MRSKRLAVILVGSVTIGLGCASTQKVGSAQAGKVPLFEGMGNHHRKVTTSSPMAQRYFDQGLVWAYAFNHDEAIRSFTEAARHDPQCAMAYWGIALCNGPHINYPMVPPDRARAACKALKEAMALKESATPTEQALIEALAYRYTDPQPADRRPLDSAYSEAMGKVYQRFPSDSDVGTLYAESLMDLQPWDLYTQKRELKPGTQEILQVLEEVIRMDPNHPGANHLYIHAVEPSAHPDQATASADTLRDLVPASGHLVHMPSHIYVLTGQWQLADDQNVKAIAADKKYRQLSPKQGFYSVYMLHNAHMLSFAASMEGRSAQALSAARAAVNTVPPEYLKQEPALVDPYMGAVYDALKRFGRWDEILAEPAPPSDLPITTAMWRYSRALAYANKKQLDLARRERDAFHRAVDNVPPDAIMAINNARHVLQIASYMLDGEIALNEGDIDECIEQLNKAIVLEDQLLYMEPPEWMQPVRHTLGAVLMSAGRYQEAEQVYRADLADWPGNGWSLYGLSRCLEETGRLDEAQRVEALFNKAWSRADFQIASSCVCVPET